MGEKALQLEDIAGEVASGKHLPLYAERVENLVLPVVGQGSPDAALMFVGEAPGKNEAIHGTPFCGAAGKILDELFESAGLSRKDVYITNIVKDRPTNNRDPYPHEIEAYAPYLMRQIDVIQPKVIATLGRHSMEYLMRQFGLEDKLKPIGVIHGTAFEVGLPYGTITLIPLYHPAAAIYTRTLLPVLKDDLAKVKTVL